MHSYKTLFAANGSALSKESNAVDGFSSVRRGVTELFNDYPLNARKPMFWHGLSVRSGEFGL